jgi:hypothetical protein
MHAKILALRLILILILILISFANEGRLGARLRLRLRGPTITPGYSHSIVAGGLLEMSKQTRLTPLTSLVMRRESVSNKS